MVRMPLPSMHILQLHVKGCAGHQLALKLLSLVKTDQGTSMVPSAYPVYNSLCVFTMVHALF